MNKKIYNFSMSAGIVMSAFINPAYGEITSAYPSRPITIVVPAPPGGIADGQARALSVPLAKAMKQPVIIDNRAGAAGVIGTGIAARASPDGYTLLYAGDSLPVSSLLYKLPYDPVKDFIPVAPLSTSPLILIVAQNVPANSVPELVELAKSKKESLSYASTGIGSPSQLGAEMFKIAAGIDLNHIPYKGGSAAINDIMGGQVQVMLIAASTAIQQIKAGKVKALAVTSLERLPALPNVPTLASFYPSFEAVAVGGLFAPRGTPHDIVARLNTEINKALTSQEIRAYMETQLMTPMSGTPEQFGTSIEKEAKKNSAIIKSLNIKAE